MFSCETCKIFKSIYFKEHLQTAASGTFRKDTELHLELSQTSKAERFAKLAISCKSYFAKRPVLDV